MAMARAWKARGSHIPRRFESCLLRQNFMIKAVLFDVDGVLIDSFVANWTFFQDLMIRFGYKPPTQEQYKGMFHLSMKDAIVALTHLTDEDEIHKIWDAGRSRKVSYHTELMTLPADAKETIQMLAKKYLLGIVTSRVKEGVYEAPQLAELKPLFKTTVTYQDTVNHKPHPEPLLLAAKHLGVAPAAAVYVGDAQTDMRAAKSAGMKFIAYTNPALEADAHVQSFGQIPDFVASLAS